MLINVIPNKATMVESPSLYTLCAWSNHRNVMDTYDSKKQRLDPKRDLTGERFGQLVVQGFSHRNPKTRQGYWKCLCDCGEVSTVVKQNLTSGKTKSCGHLANASRPVHNVSGTSASCPSKSQIYLIWSSMRTRSGHDEEIRVWPAWHNSFASFQCWSEEKGFRENASLRLWRYDNRLPYQPDNCFFAVNRHDIEIPFEGKTYTVDQWAKILDMHPATLYARIFTYHWSVEKALTLPVQRKEPVSNTQGAKNIKASNGGRSKPWQPRLDKKPKHSAFD